MRIAGRQKIPRKGGDILYSFIAWRLGKSGRYLRVGKSLMLVASAFLGIEILVSESSFSIVGWYFKLNITDIM